MRVYIWMELRLTFFTKLILVSGNRKHEVMSWVIGSALWTDLQSQGFLEICPLIPLSIVLLSLENWRGCKLYAIQNDPIGSWDSFFGSEQFLYLQFNIRLVRTDVDLSHICSYCKPPVFHLTKKKKKTTRFPSKFQIGPRTLIIKKRKRHWKG